MAIFIREVVNIKRKEIRKDIKKLISEGRFEDIYRKYGKIKYLKNISKMNQIDVYKESGNSFKSKIAGIKTKIRCNILPYIIVLGLTASGSIFGIDGSIRLEKNYNRKKYSKEIDEYNKKIREYAEYIKSMNLTDLQIFMKVMRDMWKEIDGYKEPKDEIFGYFRLSLQEEGVGVCRNFADDITAKLNAINPEYNAKNVIVYLEDTNYELAQIKRKVLKEDGEKTENPIKSLNGLKINLPNHEITSVYIQDKKITLLLDPTNPGIGVFKDGKIYMFSSKNGKGLETREISQFFIEGLESVTDMTVKKINSFMPCEYSIKELEEMYGTEAQNLALKEIDLIENKNNKKYFLEKIKSGVNVLAGDKQISNSIKELEER